jgi:hypothetical protein
MKRKNLRVQNNDRTQFFLLKNVVVDFDDAVVLQKLIPTFTTN